MNDGSGDDATQSFSTEVGNVLPSPTGTPSFSGHEEAFVVGWTEGTAESGPADYADDLAILTPGKDLVTGTMPPVAGLSLWQRHGAIEYR